MKRPYVVCHMMGSIDGRIDSDRWSLSLAAQKQYEAVHALHHADAWLCGRRTFQNDFQEQKRDATWPKAKVPPGDFIAAAQNRTRGRKPPGVSDVFAIAVDPAGKIRWEGNVMRGDRFVVLTTERAPAGYLADLRAKSISYLVAGRKEIDFAAALARLHAEFGIRKLMLEGGGSINGSLLAAGLIDEISLLVCPEADGGRGVPTVFDLPEDRANAKSTPLKLMAVHKRPGEIVWLRYGVHRGR